MSVRLAQSSFKAARSPVFSPLYNALMTTSEAAGGSATTDVMVMLRAAGKKAFFPSTNPATGWWQDSAGTTQAALEQPVGRITDLSGNGYHATQATSLNRPLYTKRVNLSQRTEDLSNAAWTAINTGSRTATTLTDSDAAANFYVRQTYTVTPGTYTARVRILKTSGAANFPGIELYCSGSAAAFYAFALNTDTGVATQASFSAAVSPVVSSSDAYWLVTIDVNTVANTSIRFGLYPAVNANGGASWVGSTNGTATFIEPDLRLSAFAAMNLPAYQRVGNGTAGVADYDTAGFRDMLYFDGTSDALATSAIDLTGTDQIMALCNVLKVSDAAAGVCYETTANYASNNGAILIAAPASATASYSGGSRGTTAASATYTNAIVASPNLACLRVVSDISTPIVTLYRNGVSIATSSSSQGTGNYGNHALNIGARAGTGTWFKGYMIPGPLLDTTGIPAALLDQMAREQAALWGVAI
jgi:hypothetical protein